MSLIGVTLRWIDYIVDGRRHGGITTNSEKSRMRGVRKGLALGTYSQAAPIAPGSNDGREGGSPPRCDRGGATEVIVNRGGFGRLADCLPVNTGNEV